MRKLSRPVVGMVLASSSTIAFAAGKDASYFCVVEAAGGISYNSTMKKWNGTSFRPDHKFILKMKFIKTGPSPWIQGKAADQYAVTITRSGEEFGVPCTNSSLKDSTIIAIEEGLSFKCEAFETYTVNLVSHRFLQVYDFGYVGGNDNNDDTPAVSAGTCTRID